MELPVALRNVARRAVDTVLPPRCLGCGAMVADAGAVCPACWGGIDFIAPPMCDSCGLPFAYETGASAVCGECARQPPLFGRARSLLALPVDNWPVLGGMGNASWVQLSGHTVPGAVQVKWRLDVWNASAQVANDVL